MPATLSQHLNNMHYDYEVDATGLKCPLPILRCKKGLNEIKSDQVLKIIATDPGSKKDFDAFCRQTGHELLSLQDLKILFYFQIFDNHLANSIRI